MRERKIDKYLGLKLNDKVRTKEKEFHYLGELTIVRFANGYVMVKDMYGKELAWLPEKLEKIK